jgi:hypothetical protein
MPLAHAECAVRMPLRHHTYLHTNPWFDCAMSHVPVYGHRAHAVLRRMPEIRPNGTARRGAPFSLSSSARSQPYMCEHLRNTLYTLVTTAVASLCARS